MNTRTKYNHVSDSTDPDIRSKATKEKDSSDCTSPALRSRVPDYIVDRLSEAMAEAVEDHLLECANCHGRYLTVIQEVAAIREKLAIANGHFDHAEEIAAAVELEDTQHS